MLPLAADENFDNGIIRGVPRRQPACDIVRVQDAGLAGAADSDVLAWAAREGRVLLTHDVATCINDAYARVCAGEPMPGLFAVLQGAPIGQVFDDLLVLIECSLEGEWEGRVVYLPIHDAR
jgi:hypothetical protein